MIDFGLFVLTLALRVAARNPHVRARLTASAVVFAVYGVIAAAVATGRVSPALAGQLRTIQPLLLAFGIINGVIALLINRWKGTGPPDRFPKIVQDAFVILLFTITATFLLQERIFAATAAGAVVVGLALQDTLGNLFAGLAIQIEKPFRIGHWVQIGGIDGQVSEVTWRATKVRTKAGNFVVVPNSKLSGDIIVNYSEPTVESRIEVDVGVSYDAAPNRVKNVILDAIRDEPLITRARDPEVLVVDFAASSINYRVRVWTTDFAADERLRDRIRSAIYYAFKRHGIEIPFPIQTEIQKDYVPPQLDVVGAEMALRSVPVFGGLSDGERKELSRLAIPRPFGVGEIIVRQGEAGSSMFIIVRGEVVVRLESGAEVARIGTGGFFGEMSLLTGAPRNATVTALVDTDLLEIALEPFRTFVLANPAVVEGIGAAVVKRRAELEERRAAGTAAAPVEPTQTLIDRIRKFLFAM